MDLARAYSHFDIGRYSYGSPEVHFESAAATLRIGQFCSLAKGINIYLGGEHRTDWVTTYPFPAMFAAAAGHHGHPATKGDVVIGNDVWIGAGATLLSGVRIGDGAVIGAGALVASDVPPYAVASGNPVRVLRKRFTDQQVECLLHIRWWDWPLERITQALPDLLCGDIDGFIRKHLGRASMRAAT